MAEKLSVIIALEGAEEIKRQLADVGKAGQDAFRQINDAAAQVGGFNKLDPSVVTEKLSAVGDVGSEAFNKVTNAVKQAGKMETLVNGIAAVENGFIRAGTAIAEMGSAIGFVLPSVKTLARLLVAAVGAATIGAIVSTTKALTELDATAIKLGVSIGELAKAQEIFKAIGIGSAAAAKGVAAFLEKMELNKVKEAIAALDEFGRPLRTNIDAMRILQEALNGSGEAADLARKALEKFGRLPPPSLFAEEIDRINQSAAAAPDKLLALLSLFQTMGNTAERNRLVFANFGKEFGATIIQMLNAGISIDDIKKKLDELVAPTDRSANAATRLSQEWEKFKALVGGAFTINTAGLERIVSILASVNAALNAFSTANFRLKAQADLAAVVQFFAALPGQITAALSALFSFDIWAAFTQAASTAANAILQFFAGLPGQIAGFFSGLGAGLWDGIVASAQAAWQTIIGYIDAAIQRVKQFFGMGGGSATAGAGGMARGGIMGGRGTGTSDSNLAWLSRGEHVMPASVVRQPGVMQLLEALRRSGGNLHGVLDRMGHFALGGMSHVTIQFPGLAPIGGLRASSAVVDELHRAAALAQVRSGGRKPSRYF